MSMINALITWVLAFVVILVLIITWQGTHSMIDTILPNALVGLGGNVSLMPTVYNTFFIMMGLASICLHYVLSRLPLQRHLIGFGASSEVGWI